MMKNIVLVEDDSNINFLVKTSMEMRRPDWKFTCFESPRQALVELGRMRPDLVMTDILMPEMDGLAFIEAAKKDHNLKNTKFIVLSADHDPSTKARAIHLGADDYWTKPLMPDKVQAAIEKHIGSD